MTRWFREHSDKAITYRWNEPFGWPQFAGLLLIGSGILLLHQH